jgi:transcriptional regulator with XRE-family HTH domain
LLHARSSDGDAREDNCHSELEELATFGAALEKLRRQSQLSYRSLSTKAGYSSSVLAKAASGRDRPTLEVVRAFVTACGGDLSAWTSRWHTMNAAVDRYQRELLAMVDTPYEFLACPSSPARFNRQLQLRVCRAGKQAAVALRANYAPSTASGVFKGTRLANEEFVRRMLAAASAPDGEQAVWLEWRCQLAREPRPATSPTKTVAPAQRSRLLRRARLALNVAVATGVLGTTGAAVAFALSSGSPGTVPLNAESRSHRADTPPPHSTTKAPSGAFDHEVGVPSVGGTPIAETARVNTVPTLPPASLAVTPDGVRRWKATTVGDRTQMDNALSGLKGWSPIRPGDTVYVVCFTTKTQPTGWYYTDRGNYLDPAIVRFSGDDKNAVPACSKVPFPEIGMALTPYEPAYSRGTGTRHSDHR